MFTSTEQTDMDLCENATTILKKSTMVGSMIADSKLQAKFDREKSNVGKSQLDNSIKSIIDEANFDGPERFSRFDKTSAVDKAAAHTKIKIPRDLDVINVRGSGGVLST